jgi:hypothetical protein
MISRELADARFAAIAEGAFTESYISPINVKCLLFLFRRAAAILANRIAHRLPAKTLLIRDPGPSIEGVGEKPQQYR